MRKIFLSAFMAFGLAAPLTAAETPLIGVVNFATCITESKAGKKEQTTMEGMRQQMTTLIEDTDKKIREMAAKFEDPEYLDSLSPKAEEDLRNKFQTLQEDLNRYQNQFYQLLNQAHYQMMQKMTQEISSAAEKIASLKGLDYVMNKEACFYIRPDLDVTQLVIGEMDKGFESNVQTSDSTQQGINAFEETMLEKAG